MLATPFFCCTFFFFTYTQFYKINKQIKGNTNKEVLHCSEVDLAVNNCKVNDDAKRYCDQWYDEREPRRHMTADLRREKLNLQRSQNNVLLYGCSCLSAINDASLLNTAAEVEPNPPVVEKTNGEKSISTQRYLRNG